MSGGGTGASSILSATTSTDPGRVALVVVLGTTALALLSKLGVADTGRYTPEIVRHVRNYIESSTQNGVIARQCTNPAIALMHSNYAIAYANAARELVSSKEDISRMTGVKIDELMHMLRTEQKHYQSAIATQCPALQVDGAYAIATGWIANQGKT